MKKTIIGACMAAVLTLGTTSCGCGEKCAVNNDSIVATELSDSINTCLGMCAGMDFGSRLTMLEKEGRNVNRKEFVKGVKFIVSREYNDDFSAGVNSGLNLNMTIDELKNVGVSIDRDAVLREVRKYIMNDNVKMIEMNVAQLNFENLMTRLQSLGDDKEIAPEMSDSINTFLGMYAGVDLSRRISMVEQSQGQTNRQAFMKGFQFIVAQNYDASYRDGVQGGLELAMTMDHFRGLGVETDRDAVMEGVCKYVNADSIDMTEMNKAQVSFEKLVNRIEAVSTNRDRMRAGLEPVDAKAQEASATKTESVYDSEMTPGNTMTIDTGDGNTMSAVVKQSPSGLIYAIFDEGTGEKIGQQSQATVQYRGMHADGSAFDQGEATFAPVQVIRGFGEGLMMLGKGGKAMFRIPGELGYGPNGVPQAGIQPNETLYFMVAVLDIK